MNKIKYKHADYLYTEHWKTIMNESNAAAMYILSCVCQMFQVNFILFLAPTEKLSFGSFLCVQSGLSFGVLSRQSTDHHVDLSGPQSCNIPCKSTEPSAICTLWKTAENTIDGEALHWLWITVKSCGKFITIGKLILYFKSSRKVKSKWPIGRRLWLLFESIWLKIAVIVCIIIMAWSSQSPVGDQLWDSGHQCKFLVALVTRKEQFRTLNETKRHCCTSSCTCILKSYLFLFPEQR